MDTQISCIPEFDELPGQSMFMTTLEAYSTSANLDVEGDTNIFQKLSLWETR